MDPYLKQLREEIAASVEGLSPAQLRWHRRGKWNIIEILEHLYLTYTGTLKGLSRSLASGAPSILKPTLKHRLQCLVVLGFGYLPAGREAPRFSRPKGLSPETVVEGIGSKIAEMDEALTRYATQFGAHRKVLSHTFLGPFSIDQWRKFHLVHGRHHLKQIRRLRSEIPHPHEQDRT